MTQRLLHLAALASHALPQVKFVALEEPQYMDEDYLLTGLADAKENHWFVICPRHPQAGVELESQAAVMLALADNGARLPFRMPRPAGFAPIKPVGRALIHPALPGRAFNDKDLEADNFSLAKSLGYALASLHDMSINVAKTAGLPIYSGEEISQQIQAKIAQADSKQALPIELKKRWLERLNDHSIWQFRPAFLHGALSSNCLYTDGSQVSGISGFGRAHMGDPATDLAWVSANAAPDFYSHFLEHYHRARPLPDSNLDTRIELHSEIALVDWLLHGIKRKQDEIISDAKELLEDLKQVLLAKGEISLEENSPAQTAAKAPTKDPEVDSPSSDKAPSASETAAQQEDSEEERLDETPLLAELKPEATSLLSPDADLESESNLFDQETRFTTAESASLTGESAELSADSGESGDSVDLSATSTGLAENNISDSSAKENDTDHSILATNSTSSNEAENRDENTLDKHLISNPEQVSEEKSPSENPVHRPGAGQADSLPEDPELADEVAKAREIGEKLAQEHSSAKNTYATSPAKALPAKSSATDTGDSAPEAEPPLLPGLKNIPDSPISNLLASFQDRLKTSAIDISEMQAEADRSILDQDENK